MVVWACLFDSGALRTDNGDDIGHLQILVGAGGTGKSFAIDTTIITTMLLCEHGCTSQKYSVHATTGKAAISTSGTTI